jgi:hypothetical protein
MLRRVTWLSLVVLLACSSNEDTVKETHDFADATGRVCQATLERTGATSPVVFSSVECDGAARKCSADSRPCFQLSVERDGTELRNCPACCRGSSSSFVGSECNAVVCDSSADCVYPEAECTSGICTCPGGRCE